MKPVRLGILGCGTIGRGLVELITRNHDVIAKRTGLGLEVRRVLVRDLKKERPVDRALLTTDAPSILEAKDIDLVVELIGGTEPARTWIAQALDAGKGVVTANKAVLAASGSDLFRRGRIGFEASACGGIPILRAVTEGLVGNRILALEGIVNGTCNFILTRMAETGCAFDAALGEAQRLGFAEADPALDLDGGDAAQKLLILAGLAFGVRLDGVRFPYEGIRNIEAVDIEAARELGYVVKHVAIARELGEELDLRVHAVFLPAVHPLAHVRNEFNSVLLRGDAAGDLVFTGRGAGSLPTASAVLSDIVEIARDGAPWRPPESSRKLCRDFESKYYLRFPIIDVPGVIGLIATALGNHGISISHASAALVPEREGVGNVRILAHRCAESALQRAIEEVSRLPVLTRRPVVLRIFEEEGASGW